MRKLAGESRLGYRLFLSTDQGVDKLTGKHQY